MKDQEAKKLVPPPKTCGECEHLGTPVKFVKYKGKERTELYKCDIHDSFNTKYAVRCSDWEERTT